MNGDKEIKVKALCFKAAVEIYCALMKQRDARKYMEHVAPKEITFIANDLFHSTRKDEYWKTHEENFTEKKKEGSTE